MAQEFIATVRFIPAGAGNSCDNAFSVCHLPVYPRWRGELRLPAQYRWAKHGLSPLARGTHLHNQQFVFYSRFIPAGAGNSYLGAKYGFTCAVYPRWRGELSASTKRPSHRAGLSPLARGTRVGGWKLRARKRFIPAGAGNSPPERLTKYFFSVYPRWRGELAIRPDRSNTSQRFIPAGAGNSIKASQ